MTQPGDGAPTPVRAGDPAAPEHPELTGAGPDHAGPGDAEQQQRAAGASSRLISASALMAAGTLTSRVLGFARLMLLVMLFGNGSRQAEMFTLANTVPNSMYILLAGGVLNTVLVPQIVKAIKSDSDGGEAYTNRIMTAGLIGLGLITIVLTLAAPWVIWLFSSSGWKAPGLAAEYDSMVILAYYCMPQIFFYGVHVLAGQVLNARDKFGPMMWAPIANNIVSIAVLGLFWFSFGSNTVTGAFSTNQELLLGLGSTLGIAVQALVLLPFLRAAGYRFSPRFDFKGTGLGHTFQLAKWTLGFVAVTQAGLVVINKLASSATVGGSGAGLTAYYNAYAVWILPHSLITVSLATAMLPAASRLAHQGDWAGVRSEGQRAIRLALTALLPASLGLMAIGMPIARLAFGFGAGAQDFSFVGWTLIALAAGLVPFTVQYLCLRIFYASEDTRTPFFLQLLITGANAGLGIAAVLVIDRPSLVAPALGAAYSVSYVIGVVVTFRRLRRRLPGWDSHEVVRHSVRLLVAMAPGAAVVALLGNVIFQPTSKVVAAAALVGYVVFAGAAFVGCARVLHIAEVSQIVATVTRPGRGPQPQGVPEQAADSTGSGGSTPKDGGYSHTIHSGTTFHPPAATVGSADLGGPTQDAATMASHLEVTGRLPPTSQPDHDSNESEDPPARAGPGPEDTDSHERADGISAAAALPAGTVLADRYKLEEILGESAVAVSWRAFDEVLSRSVLVHLLAPGDPAAPELLADARRAAVATDSRFLRVLDAVHSDSSEVGSYIVCEYAIGRSLEHIVSQGPLSGLEAAWVVRETADALSVVHSMGLFHRRISPDTVIITPTGNVKIVGLLIEADLRASRGSHVPGADTPELVDVFDLGRLLYCCLVSRWPGGPAYSLPAAPPLGDRWLTPRQIRAGVSPALDAVCDQILSDPPRNRRNAIHTANGVVDALTTVLGTADASSDLERRLRQPVPRVGGVDVAAPVSALLSVNTEEMDPMDLPGGRSETTRHGSSAVPEVNPGSRDPYATGHGSATEPVDERSWTTVIRQPPPQHRPAVPAQEVQRQPRRRLPVRVWLLILALALLLSAGTVAAMIVLDRRTSGEEVVTSAPSVDSASPTPVGSAIIPIVGGRDFDPEGDDQTENPDEVKNAFDGDPQTRWRTLAYRGSPKLGNIKRGVGLVVDLGSATPVGSVRVSLSGEGTAVEARVPADDPAGTTTPPMNSDSQWEVVASAADAQGTLTLTPGVAVTTRYVLIYLTSLPKEGTNYRGGIIEVEVLR